MNRIKSFFAYLFLFLLVIIMVFPLFWMFLLSLKEIPERYTSLVQLLISDFTLRNYSEAFSTDSFLVYFVNSLFVASFVTIGNVIFCFLVAYAFERKKFPLNRLLFITILAVLIIPQHIIMIPLYRLMVSFDWINTYFALTVPWLVTPFGIFLVKQYIQQLPVEIEEAAKLDGCGDWKLIFKIVMPLSLPILTVLAIYTFLSNWNAFLFPFLFTNEESMRTLPVGLAFYLGKQSIDWGHLMAGASISSLPIIIIFLIFQRHIIKGLVAGALKG